MINNRPHVENCPAAGTRMEGGITVRAPLSALRARLSPSGVPSPTGRCAPPPAPPRRPPRLHGGRERCAPRGLPAHARGARRGRGPALPRGMRAVIAKFDGKWAPAGGEAAPPPPRGAPLAAVVPAPAPRGGGNRAAHRGFPG